MNEYLLKWTRSTLQLTYTENNPEIIYTTMMQGRGGGGECLISFRAKKKLKHKTTQYQFTKHDLEMKMECDWIENL